MRNPIWRGVLVSLVMMLIGSGVGVAAAAPAADGPNLLQNPGFESPYVKQCCQTDLSKYLPNTPIDEVQVASGWNGWWLQPDQDAQHPSVGGNPSWHRPEWREANCGSVCANRIRSGGNAQKYFTFFSVHDAGMYQQVGGITPGTLLRFSIYMQAWSVNATSGASDRNQHMGMRVGIDPFGGTDGFSPNIVWSAPFDTFDAWGLYTVEATARSGTATVFTRSTPQYGNEHNDIYLDDASLVAVDASSAGGGSSEPTPAPQPTLAPQPTVEPTAAAGFTYVVQRGDNFYRIAQRFGVDVSQIYEANHITNPNLLFVGTVLIIPGANPPPDNGGGAANNPPPAPAPTVAPVTGFQYVVQPGDNYFSIAQRFGISYSQLIAANHITDTHVLFVGTVLIIPDANAPAASGGQVSNPPAQAPGAFAYTVQPGDNLFRISLRFGVSIARIKELNGLVSDIIFVGQTLIIAS